MDGRRFIFAMRVSENERAKIALLARRLMRSDSDAIRFVIMRVVDELCEQELDDGIDCRKPNEEWRGQT